MSHRENVLSESSSGQVVRCLCCDTLSVQFGNFVLQQLTIPQFHVLQQRVAGMSLECSSERGKKTIYLSAVKGRVMMGFTVAEFYEFQELLEEAAQQVPWLKQTSRD